MKNNMRKAKLPRGFRYLEYTSDETWDVIKKWKDINLKSSSGDNIKKLNQLMLMQYS